MDKKEVPQRKQITLRIPGTVYEALGKMSNESGISIHSLILMALSFHLGIFEDIPQLQ